MRTVLEQMLNSYRGASVGTRKNAVKEILQEIALCGFARAGFFKEAAFYGGTALRIFYGLDRFSEDLDFSLMAENPDFDLSVYLPVLESEMRSFGLNVSVTEKKKEKGSDIRSAFLRGNTRELLLLFYPQDNTAERVARNELVKIKIEVDVKPPKNAAFERKYRLLPSPHEVNLFDLPSLFAGKIHAVLARNWRSRIKGRDLYDYVFFLSRGVAVNLPHLRRRLIDSDFMSAEEACSLEDVKKKLCERFGTIDFSMAKQDVLPFIDDVSSLDVWCAEFFQQITEKLR